MKTAECTHCYKSMTWDEDTKQWEHDVPTPGLKPAFCQVIKVATPRRGSIRKF